MFYLRLPKEPVSSCSGWSRKELEIRKEGDKDAKVDVVFRGSKFGVLAKVRIAPNSMHQIHRGLKVSRHADMALVCRCSFRLGLRPQSLCLHR